MNVICGVALLVTALVSNTRAGPLGSLRIVNGTEISIDQVPYQVYLQSSCGGTILTRRHIVTAAHCSMHGVSEFIRAGSSDRENGGQVVKVSKQINHPKSDVFSVDYDFGLIVLAEDLVFNENVQPIDLAREPAPDGTMFLVSGWGQSNDDSIDRRFLRAVELPQINHDKCYEMYKNSDYPNVGESMVCAGYEEGGKSACNGDSGGPLVFNNKLYGVVSWLGRPCGSPGFPTVSGSIPEVYDWYKDIIKATL